MRTFIASRNCCTSWLARVLPLALFAVILLGGANVRAQDQACEARLKAGPDFCKTAWKKYFSVGPALSALSVNLDSAKIGLFDTAAAIELHMSNLQYSKSTLFRADGQPERVNMALWEWAIGVQVKKPQESSDVAIGFYVVPYAIRVESFSLGVGLLYSTVGSLGWSWSRFNIMIPLSYSFNL
jgi:hypothetical protein